MKYQILSEELLPNEANIITESSQDGKNVWLNGIMMQSSVKNRNGRNYPLSEISNAVRIAGQLIREQNGIMGELDHPKSLQINLDRVSHVITEMWMQGNDAYGKAKLLNTPMGNIAQELIRGGVRIGVSSRGAGTVLEGTGEVNGFKFVTVDLVAQPSAPQAYPSSIYESLERAQNGNQIVTLAEAVREYPEAQKYLQREIYEWLSTNIFKKR
jgi:hypothetical protein